MKYFTCLIRTLTVLALFYLIFPEKAYAYMDMGSLSYILQLIVAALVGILLTTKIVWHRIRFFFKKLFSREEYHE